MAKKCCVQGCYSYIYTHILVHRFPTNVERAKQWRQLVDNPQLYIYPIEELNKKFSICTNHFRMDDYKSYSRKLKNSAIPSLGLPNSKEPKPAVISSSSPFRIPSPVNAVKAGTKRKSSRISSDEMCRTSIRTTASSESGISSPGTLSTDLEDIPPVVKVTRKFRPQKNCSRAYHKYLYNTMDPDSADNSDCECEAINERDQNFSPFRVQPNSIRNRVNSSNSDQ